MPTMPAAISRYGISILYRCYSAKYTLGPFHPKCPDADTDKCFRCEHCRAEMSAYDATRMLQVFGRSFAEKAADGQKGELET